MPKPAVFLDRDGTINEQVGYVNHVSRLWLLPGAAAAIARLNERSIPVIVVSNQAGAARGYFPPSLIEQVNARMHELLAAEGAHVDALYFCPHLPSSKLPELAVDCNCRKPRPGMLLRAAQDHDIDLATSFVVGDRMGDVAFGQSVGATGILVLTGYGRGEHQFIGGTTPDHVAPSLPEAVDFILQTMATRART